MAKKKKKRGFPSKQCPGCGKIIHARKFECPHCGHDFGLGNKYAKREKAGEPVAPAKAKPIPTGKKPVVASGPLAAVNQAAATIKDLGGLEKVEELIAQAKEVQAAIDRLGGMDDAESIVKSVEMLKGL